MAGISGYKAIRFTPLPKLAQRWRTHDFADQFQRGFVAAGFAFRKSEPDKAHFFHWHLFSWRWPHASVERTSLGPAARGSDLAGRRHLGPPFYARAIRAGSSV